MGSQNPTNSINVLLRQITPTPRCFQQLTHTLLVVLGRMAFYLEDLRSQVRGQLTSFSSYSHVLAQTECWRTRSPCARDCHDGCSCGLCDSKSCEVGWHFLIYTRTSSRLNSSTLAAEDRKEDLEVDMIELSPYGSINLDPLRAFLHQQDSVLLFGASRNLLGRHARQLHSVHWSGRALGWNNPEMPFHSPNTVFVARPSD